MKDKLSIFNKSQLYDRASVAGLWLFVLLMIVLPQESKVISVFALLICYFLVHAGCAIHNLLPFLSRRLKSIEKVYEGNFDQLVKEMVAADLDSAQRDYVRMVHEAGDALLTLINDILDFSKIEAGKFVLESTEFNVAETLGELSRHPWATSIRLGSKSLQARLVYPGFHHIRLLVPFYAPERGVDARPLVARQWGSLHAGSGSVLAGCRRRLSTPVSQLHPPIFRAPLAYEQVCLSDHACTWKACRGLSSRTVDGIHACGLLSQPMDARGA